MAALPDNYVSLQQLRERWLQRQREGQQADDRERNLEKRLGKTRLSAREWGENGGGDIADRRRSSNWSRNEDGGGASGGCWKGAAAAAAPEGFARDWRCVGMEVGESSCSERAVVGEGIGKEAKRGDHRRPTSSDRGQRGFERSGSGLVNGEEDGAQGKRSRPSGRNMAGGRDCGDGRRKELASPVMECKSSDQPNPRRSEREVGESCSARAVVGEGIGKDAKRGDRSRPTSSDRGQRGFRRPGSGLVNAEEDGARGNGSRPSGRNMAGGRDGGDGRRQELVSPTVECKASDQPNPRRSEREVRCDAQKTRIVHKEVGGSIESVCPFSTVADESRGKEVKSVVFPEKRGHSGKKNRGMNKEEAGVVGPEGVQRGGNWGCPHFRRNKGGHSGGRARSLREEVASVVGIVPLGQHCPSSLNNEVVLGNDIPNDVPVHGLKLLPDKELIESVCCATVVEENSAKGMKREEYEGKSDGGCEWRRCDKGRNKLGLLKGKEEEDRVYNLTDNGHDTPAKAAKEECRGNELRIGEDPTRSNKPRWKGGKKKKHKGARTREKEVQADKPADRHDMAFDAVTLFGGKESVALEGTYLGVNGRGNARGVISGPRRNGFSCREWVVIREDVEILEDFSKDKEAFNKEVEPADMSNRTEGKLGYQQKNDISSEKMMFRSNGKIVNKFRGFSIGSTSRQDGQNRRLSHLAENSHNWSKRNSKWESRDLASRVETDMIWVKKGDALGGNNANYVSRDR